MLDQLGLPQGVVDGPVSDLVTVDDAASSAGDSFKIAVNGGSPVTITIKATDTMASLATEIAKATGFHGQRHHRRRRSAAATALRDQGRLSRARPSR